MACQYYVSGRGLDSVKIPSLANGCYRLMPLFFSISVAKRLERVAIEYNQMQYLVTKGASLPFVTNIDWVGLFSDLDVFA